MLKDTSAKLKQCGLRYVRISMDGKETLEARFLGMDSVVLDVWQYYCAYVVHVSSMMLFECSVVYI